MQGQTPEDEGVQGRKAKQLDDFIPVDPLLGQLVADRFKIERLIGTGGWSRVYRAVESSTGEAVALKVLHAHLITDGESLARFAREAESGISLSHENICRVFDYDRLPTGQPYMAMEYLEGISLADELREKETIDSERAVRIFKDCCHGLAAAHKKGIVHRDIKPANIFLIDSSSTVKLLDFGMAKILEGVQPDITQTGTAFGTVQYMSPEQVTGTPIDERSDIYSLGCVMYEALSGSPPFHGTTAYEIMDSHVRKQVKRFQDIAPGLDVPADLEQLVLKTLEKDKDRRVQSASQLSSRLESLSIEDTCSARGSNPLVGKGLLALLVAVVTSACLFALTMVR